MQTYKYGEEMQRGKGRANKQALLIQAAGVVHDETVNKAWSFQRQVDEKQISVGLHRGAEMMFS